MKNQISDFVQNVYIFGPKNPLFDRDLKVLINIVPSLATQLSIAADK
jgi:hypothetical protein